MKRLNFELIGDTPLIMHSDTMVDPFHDLTREKKRLTSKKTNKTDDDLRRIDEIEFTAGLYLHDTLGPVIPGANVDRMIVDAAKRTKAGNKAKMGLQAAEDYFPLQYDGPRDLSGLLADGKFHFRKSIKQGTSRIMRVRPWFHNWTVKVSIDYDEKIFDRADVVEFLATAGAYVGLCDWRPRYGRFTVGKPL